MGVKKFKNLFTPSGSKKQFKTASGTTEPARSNPKEKEQSIRDKAEIESYIKSINSKLKDPKMAKKAGQILNNWLEKK